MFTLVAVVAIASTWIGSIAARARRQAIEVEKLERAHILVQYDFQWDESKQQFDMDLSPPGANWVRRILGEFAFAYVILTCPQERHQCLS